MLSANIFVRDNMNIDQILQEWNKDSEIDPLNIQTESLTTSKLHHKYLKILSEERRKLLLYQGQYKQLFLAKQEHLLGIIDQEELNKRGWKPNPLKIIRTDLPQYIDADPDVIELSLKIGVVKEKIDVLTSIINSINNRGFQIKNHIDYLKFTNGS